MTWSLTLHLTLIVFVQHIFSYLNIDFVVVVVEYIDLVKYAANMT